MDKFYICDCYTEGMSVTSFPEEDSKLPKPARSYYFSYWERGHNSHNYNWKLKLIHIWKVLWEGTPYKDEVILNEEKAVELALDILDQYAVNNANYNKYLETEEGKSAQ